MTSVIGSPLVATAPALLVAPVLLVGSVAAGLLTAAVIRPVASR